MIPSPYDDAAGSPWPGGIVLHPRIRTTLLASALCLSGMALVAPAAGAAPADSNQWTPFFDSGSLKGSAWADCADPIVMSVDPRALPKSQQKSAKAAFETSVKNWAKQTGLHFVYGGVTPINYNDTTYVISPVDGVDRPRHMYITLLTNAESTYLTDRVVGMAMPTAILPDNKEIIQAEGAFRTDYVANSTKEQRVAVFMHELGHTLGLGHSGSKDDIMYPIVDKQTKLGPGDIAGIKAILRPCTTPPAS
jgi:hypothetical protein